MKKKGIGFASAWQGSNYHFGHLDEANVNLEITNDLRCRIGIAVADMGQGIPETLATIVSSELGDFPLERIDFLDPDTSITPDGGATGASRLTAMAGNAVARASRHLAHIMKTVAAELLDTSPVDVKIADSIFYGREGASATFQEVLDECKNSGIQLSTSVHFEGPPTEDLDERGQGFGVNDFGYATYVVEVEVDTETGEVQVLNVRAFVDAGKMIRPMGAEMQVEGGIAMGLGHALTEDLILRDGWPETNKLSTYLIPSVRDVPQTVETQFIDKATPTTELGAKGMAELVLVPIAPAIINAIHDAVGVRITHLPATPERVLAAIDARSSNNGGEDHG